MPWPEKGITGIFRTTIVLLVFICAFSSLKPVSAAQDGPEPIKEITVAVGQDTIPFYFSDPKGVADGWLVDIWRLWSQKSGIKVKFVMAPFGETLQLAKEGKVDVQGGCFYSEERAQYLDYATPLINTDTHFFFHKNIYGIETLNDLLGFRIGVIKGDFAVGYLRKHLPGVTLAEYATNGALFKALEKGEIRVFAMDTPVALYFLKKMKLFSSFRYYPDKPLYSNVFQAAVKKDDTVLPPVIKRGFAMISPEEKLRIERRWFGSKQIKTEGVLTIACDRYYPPFTMLTPSGRPAGIFIDLWRLWASKNFRNIEFIFGEWEETIRMVKDGRADIHSGLYETREREAFLSFSVPLFAVQDCLAFKINREPLPLSALAGTRVGVIAGSGEASRLREHYPGIILSAYNGYQKLITALEDGEVMAVYDNGASLQHVIEDMGLQGEINIAMASASTRDVFAGVLKKEKLRLKAINTVLDKITNQEIQAIEARWVTKPALRLFSGKARPLVLTVEEKQWLKSHSRIKLGIDPDAMPFEAFGPGEVYEGLSSSYVDILNRKLGVNMVPVKGLGLMDMRNAAEAGMLDVLPCIAKTSKRSGFLDFTRPYLDFPIVVVTRRDAPFIPALYELKGRKVAVVQNNYERGMLEKHYPKIRLFLVKDVEQGLKAVKMGEAVAYMDNSASAIYTMRKLGLKDLKVAFTTPYRVAVRFAVRKDWPQLTNILEKALQSITETEREKITNRWVNVRFTERADWGHLLRIGIAVAVIIGLILIIIVFWNRRLSREVRERKRAEERFQAIAATTPGAIIQVRFDAEGQPEYLYLSAKAEAFFGMPSQQVIQEKKRLRWYPDDQKRIREEVRTAFSAGEDLNLVGRIQPMGGEAKWIRLNASPSRSSERGLIYNGFILDITERKLAEQEYLNSERKIKAMSQAVDDALVMINDKGAVMFWNPAAESLFGYTAGEAMGREFHEMAVPEADRVKALAGLDRFSRTGTGAMIGKTIETTARGRTGRIFPVEVNISSFRVDHEWFAVGTVRDISERKKAEEAIIKSERRVKSILETANEGFLLLDNKQEVIDVNPEMCRILGRGRDDALGKTIFEFVDEKNKKIFMAQIEFRKRGITGAYEITLLRPQGGQVACLFNSTPLLDEKKQEIGAFAMVTDITDRKKAEDRLRFTQTMVDKAALSIFWVDPETGMFVYANEAACNFLGYTREELLSMQILQIDAAFNEEKFSHLMEALQIHSNIETEGIHHTKDGRPINVTLSIVLTQLEESRIIAVFARDITNRLKAERELKQKLEELEWFNRLVVGREVKMIQLKEEINGLLAKFGREVKYEIVE